MAGHAPAVAAHAAGSMMPRGDTEVRGHTVGHALLATVAATLACTSRPWLQPLVVCCWCLTGGIVYLELRLVRHKLLYNRERGAQLRSDVQRARQSGSRLGKGPPQTYKSPNGVPKVVSVKLHDHHLSEVPESALMSMRRRLHTGLSQFGMEYSSIAVFEGCVHIVATGSAQADDDMAGEDAVLWLQKAPARWLTGRITVHTPGAFFELTTSQDGAVRVVPLAPPPGVARAEIRAVYPPVVQAGVATRVELRGTIPEGSMLLVKCNGVKQEVVGGEFTRLADQGGVTVNLQPCDVGLVELVVITEGQDALVSNVAPVLVVQTYHSVSELVGHMDAAMRGGAKMELQYTQMAPLLHDMGHLLSSAKGHASVNYDEPIITLQRNVWTAEALSVFLSSEELTSAAGELLLCCHELGIWLSEETLRMLSAAGVDEGLMFPPPNRIWDPVMDRYCKYAEPEIESLYLRWCSLKMRRSDISYCSLHAAVLLLYAGHKLVNWDFTPTAKYYYFLPIVGLLVVLSTTPIILLTQPRTRELYLRNREAIVLALRTLRELLYFFLLLRFSSFFKKEEGIALIIANGLHRLWQCISQPIRMCTHIGQALFSILFLSSMSIFYERINTPGHQVTLSLVTFVLPCMLAHFFDVTNRHTFTEQFRTKAFQLVPKKPEVSTGGWKLKGKLL
mmetsp:Transcript_1745/g.6086  ORF Transcript_1745/g.6086 Transcript_1745/m.6086 type:complete len:676 (-) Transcript_1745:3726-5753(-)